jgi:Beta-ketoacyl synthase, N-terminal domain
MATQSTANAGDASPNGIGENTNGHAESSFPVAIIGMSCRFAGEATSPSKLWELCAAGKGAWTPIPSNRWDAKSLYDAKKGKTGRVGCAGSSTNFVSN